MGTDELVAVLENILDSPKPTIAKVQGHVAGGGNGLVAACDFAVASEEFIECSAELRGAHPPLYSLLQEFYGIDPASWDTQMVR